MTLRLHKHTHGFSLLELLLALGVFTSVMLGILQLLTTFSERELARASNRYMMSVLDATKEILSTPSNFTVLYEAAKATGGGYQLIADKDAPAQDNIMKQFSITTVPTGTVTIQKTRKLNDQFTQNSPLRSQVRILLRIADDPSTENDVRALEILIVTRTPVNDDIAQKTANEGGANGGYIGTVAGGVYTGGYATKGSASIIGSFHGWALSMTAAASRIDATDWYKNDLKAGPVKPGTDGTYLVYYDYVNQADVMSDYLYRIPDTSPSHDLNTMYGPLNMGGHSIIGADDVYIGNGSVTHTFASGEAAAECVDGVMCVESMGIVKGSATVGGTMTVNGSALVADSAKFASMRVQNGLTSDADRQAYGAQGLFVVDGDDSGGGGSTSDTVTVTGTSTYQDGMSVTQGNLGAITATSVAMPQASVLTAQTINNARKVSATTISSDSLTATGQLKAGIVSGKTLTVSGRSGVIDIGGTVAADQVQYLQMGAAAGVGLNFPRVSVGKMMVSNFKTCGDCPK